MLQFDPVKGQTHDKIVAAFLMCLFACILCPSAGLRAEGECLPHSGEPVYFCDPLDGTPITGTVDKEVNGGTSVDGVGWRVNDWPNHLKYDIGDAADSGTLSFYLRGISDASLLGGYVGAPEGEVNACTHYHYFSFWDAGGHGAAMSEASYYTIVRAWGGDADPVNWGRLRFSFVHGGNPEAVECGDPNSVYIPRLSEPRWSWDDETHWYHIEMQFGAGQAFFRIDGQEFSVPYDCPAVLRYIYLPLNPFTRAVIDALGGTVYSHVSFVGTVPCVDPCDDGNPCTTGDHCAAGVCTGDPEPDGTSCDDDNPETVDDACLDGVCTGTIPPEPDNDIAEGVDVIEPIVEGEADPEAEAVAEPVPDGASDPDAGGPQTTTGGCGCTIIV